ncbi:MAG: hypothetical protein KDC95_01185 [Planctomycetes bacterium]|nr:hypothetical protein [Planctomycetota bacterium]
MPASKFVRLSAILAVSVAPLTAQASLVHDLDPTPVVTSSDPVAGRDAGFVKLGTSSRILCTAKLRRDARSLVRFDVTSGQSTVLVPELGYALPVFTANAIAELGASRAILTVFDPATGPGLATTDGTAAGTTLAVSGITTTALTPFGARVLFVTTTMNGNTLHVSDGTAAGTLALGTWQGVNPKPLHVDPAGKFAYFVVTTSSNGSELGFTDGTPQGTRLIDIRAGSGSSTPSSMIALDPLRVVFAADDGVRGRELWISDGTASGTKLVVDIVQGIGSSNPEDFVWLGTKLYFEARRTGLPAALFTTDGTTTGTTHALDLTAPTSVFEEPTVHNGRVYFRGLDAQRGEELFATDGTFGGTKLVSDIAGGASSSSPRAFVSTQLGLCFCASTPTHGEELWLSQGTPSSTQLLADINPGTASSDIAHLTEVVPGRVAMIAFDAAHGRELWTSGGTTASTQRQDLFDVPGATADSNPRDIVRIADRVAMIAERNDTLSVWSSSPSSAGPTEVLKLGSANAFPNVIADLLAQDGHALLRYYPASTTGDLWTTDGTVANTRVLRAGFAPLLSVIDGNRCFYHSGTEVGVLDGRTGTSVRLASATSPVPIRASRANRRGEFLFETNGELRISDGTVSGTRSFYKFCTSLPCSNSRDYVPLGQSWIFSASTAASGTEVWVSDGTAAGTRLLRDIDPGVGDSFPEEFCVQNGRVYFECRHPQFGRELWSTDGTTSGTQIVLDAIPGTGSLDPRHLTPVGTDRIYFAGNVPGLGRELCLYDTRTSTFSIAADVRPGLPSSAPSNTGPFAVIGSKVHFVADDGVHGRELWSFDNGATSTPFGTACAQLALDASTDPRLGSTVVLTSNSPSTRVHVTLLGTPDFAGLALNAMGCRAYVALASYHAVFSVGLGTTSSFSVPIPNSSSLLGIRAALQTIAIDPNSPSTIESSNGLDWTLGR